MNAAVWPPRRPDPEPQVWQDRARCAEVDPDLFFPEKGETAQKAKFICSGCEVWAECLAYALGNGEQHGVWAGRSERQIRRMVADERRRRAAAA
jgi:WhiB family transcriptional regulator, redox-sensing transcriptional regulator